MCKLSCVVSTSMTDGKDGSKDKMKNWEQNKHVGGLDSARAEGWNLGRMAEWLNGCHTRFK